MTQYYLGVDIGNSKCHAAVANEQGVIVGFAPGGVGSQEQIGYEGFTRVLTEMGRQSFAMAGITSVTRIVTSPRLGENL